MEMSIRGNDSYVYTGGTAFDSKLPTLVFVHGAQHDHCVWALQSRYLARHGYGVLAVDLPGHGRSVGPPLASVEAMADWIIALLDAIGVARAALIGHSMGSLVALECAGRHAERVGAVALIAAAFPMQVSAALLDATRSDEALAREMVAAWSHAGHAHVPGNPGPGVWLAGANLRLMQRQRRGVMYVDFAACDAYSAGLERAAQLRCPALILHGANDIMTPPRRARALVDAIGDARRIEIPGAGHALMAEKPDQVLDALIDFLRPVSTPAGAAKPVGGRTHPL